jgi:hypothetical protein
MVASAPIAHALMRVRGLSFFLKEQRKMKKNFTVTETPYLTRSELIEIADKGFEWDYNRQLCPEKIRRLPDDLEIVYPVEHHFPHERRRFGTCETHMRLVITIQGSIATADVPLAYFESRRSRQRPDYCTAAQQA